MAGWGDKLRLLGGYYRQLYEQPLRRQIALEERRRDDFFRLLILSESLGLPNPAAWYSLELMPFLLEDFHQWHRRMGMEHSPVDGFRCC